MQKKIYLRWDDDNFAVDSFEIYRDIAPMDIENLPAPIAIVDANKRYYEDSDVVEEAEYYYRIGAVLGADKRISSEIVASTLVGGDPHWDKVVSLLHFEGDFTDETGLVWTPSGGVTTTSHDAKFGLSAGFPGGNNDYVGSNLILNFGSEDFCIEAFVKPNVAHSGTIISNRNQAVGGWQFQLMANGGVVFANIAGASLQTNAGVVQNGVWTHVAFSREGGIGRIFINGVNDATAAISAAKTSDKGVSIGSMIHNDNRVSFNGSLDELRVTRGVARYTENFTPPTEPFPNFKPSVAPDPHWDNVAALLHFDGDLTDETGRVWESEFSPQFAPNSLSSQFGESILLASVDKLSTSGGGNLAFGIEDFTIEGWFRPTKSASGFGEAFFLNLGINQSNGIAFSLDRLGRLEIRRTTSSRIAITTSIRDSSLSFLTICRVGNTLYIGVNGLVTSHTYSLFSHTHDGTVAIAGTGAAYSYSGEIDELRITKGVARYTEDFTPPTEPFPNF